MSGAGGIGVRCLGAVDLSSLFKNICYDDARSLAFVFSFFRLTAPFDTSGIEF